MDCREGDLKRVRAACWKQGFSNPTGDRFTKLWNFQLKIFGKVKHI
jgi:hypothetical protein